MLHFWFSSCLEDGCENFEELSQDFSKWPSAPCLTCYPQQQSLCAVISSSVNKLHHFFWVNFHWCQDFIFRHFEVGKIAWQSSFEQRQWAQRRCESIIGRVAFLRAFFDCFKSLNFKEALHYSSKMFQINIPLHLFYFTIVYFYFILFYFKMILSSLWVSRFRSI